MLPPIAQHINWSLQGYLRAETRETLDKAMVRLGAALARRHPLMSSVQTERPYATLPPTVSLSRPSLI